MTQLPQPKPQPLTARSSIPGNVSLSAWQSGEWIKIDRKPLWEVRNEVYDEIKRKA